MSEITCPECGSYDIYVEWVDVGTAKNRKIPGLATCNACHGTGDKTWAATVASVHNLEEFGAVGDGVDGPIHLLSDAVTHLEQATQPHASPVDLPDAFRDLVNALRAWIDTLDRQDAS